MHMVYDDDYDKMSLMSLSSGCLSETNIEK